MSGILNVLAASKRLSPFVTSTVDLTSGSTQIAGGGVQPDAKYWGYDSYTPFGSRSPTSLGGYTISEFYEVLSFDTMDGTYSTPTLRELRLQFTGGSTALKAADIYSITCPGGIFLASGAATFGASGDGGLWVWTVSTGSDAAAYCNTGTLTVTA